MIDADAVHLLWRIGIEIENCAIGNHRIDGGLDAIPIVHDIMDGIGQAHSVDHAVDVPGAGCISGAGLLNLVPADALRLLHTTADDVCDGLGAGLVEVADVAIDIAAGEHLVLIARYAGAVRGKGILADVVVIANGRTVDVVCGELTPFQDIELGVNGGVLAIGYRGGGRNPIDVFRTDFLFQCSTRLEGAGPVQRHGIGLAAHRPCGNLAPHGIAEGNLLIQMQHEGNLAACVLHTRCIEGLGFIRIAVFPLIGDQHDNVRTAGFIPVFPPLGIQGHVAFHIDLFTRAVPGAAAVLGRVPADEIIV